MLDNLSPLAGDDVMDTGDAGAGLQDDMPPEAGSEGASEFISTWLAKIDEDLVFHKGAFDIMEDNMKFAEGIQWPGQTENDDRYVADITQAIVRRRVNSLYAKNPSIVARIHERMDFEIWDEDYETLARALQNPMDPMNMMILQDVQQGLQRRQIIKKMGRTLEIVIKRQISQQQPVFKREMKRMLRREEITGVGYIKLDYIRELDVKPDIEAQIADMANRLAEIRRLTDEQTSGDGCDYEGDMFALQASIKSLHEQKYILRKEGAVFRFPKTNNIIIDRNCTQVEGFVGAGHVAERFWMTDEKIKKVYGADVGAESQSSGSSNREAKWSMKNVMTEKNRLGRPRGAREVFLVHDIDSGTNFTICRGHDDFLEAPGAPDIITEQFFPYYPIIFNETESSTTIYPRSTVRLVMHQQREFNRSKEALRQHRIASKPLYASATGALDEEDKTSIAGHEAHDVIELSNLQEGQKVEDKFGMVKKHGIDPNVYETNSIFDDATKIIGTAPSTLGVTSDSTATESTIAEASNQSDAGSNADDQDDMLSILMNDVGHNLMLNMSPDTAKKIAGRGAIWPETVDSDLINDIYCDIVAGSSGRPNRAAESVALQRLYPMLIQLPGMKAEWLARKGIQAIDENTDLTDAFLEGLPAIIAQVTAASKGAPQQPITGDPAQAPANQGLAGASNAPVPAGAMPPPGVPLMPGAGGITAQPHAEGGMLSQARRLVQQGRPA